MIGTAGGGGVVAADGSETDEMDCGDVAGDADGGGSEGAADVIGVCDAAVAKASGAKRRQRQRQQQQDPEDECP